MSKGPAQYHMFRKEPKPGVLQSTLRNFGLRTPRSLKYGMETCQNVRFCVRTSFIRCTRLGKELIVLMNVYEDGAVFTLRMFCRLVTFECPRGTKCFEGSPALWSDTRRTLVHFADLWPAYVGMSEMRNQTDSNARSPGVIQLCLTFRSHPKQPKIINSFSL